MTEKIQYRIVESRKTGTNQVVYTHAQLETDFVRVKTLGGAYVRRKGDLACKPKYRAPKLAPSFCSTITCKTCLQRLEGRKARLVR